MEPYVEEPTEGPSKPQEPAPQGGPWGFWATLGSTVFTIVFWVGGSFAIGILAIAIGLARSPADFKSGLGTALLATASGPLLFLPPVLFAQLRKGMSLTGYLAVRRPRLLSLGIWLGACLVLMAFTDVVSHLAGRPLVPEVMADAYRTAGWLPLLHFAVCIVAPLTEETLFRGFAYRGFASSWMGPLGAIAATAFLWSLLHAFQYDMFDLSLVFLAGLLLGAARYESKSVLVPMAMHFVWNVGSMIETAYVVGME